MPLVLPDLGLIAGVLALLIIAGALWVLSRVLGTAFGYVPVVGGWIKSHLDSALNDARNAVLKAAGSTWDTAVHLFNWAGDLLAKPLDALVLGFSDVATWCSHMARVTIPAVYDKITAQVSAALADAYGRAESLYHAAERDITAAEAVAIARAETWYHDAERDITAAEAAAEKFADAGIRAAEAAAAAAVARLAAEVTAADTALQRDITAAAAAAQATAISTAEGYARVIYTDIDNWGTQALDRVWPDADQAIDGLRQALGGGFPDVQDLLGALGGLGAAGLLGALIRSLAGTAALTQLAEDCIVPNCRNLSQFGRDLQGLLGDVPAAAMLAWFIFLVADPSGWAADTYAAGEAVATAATTAARDLLGAR